MRPITQNCIISSERKPNERIHTSQQFEIRIRALACGVLNEDTNCVMRMRRIRWCHIASSIMIQNRIIDEIMNGANGGRAETLQNFLNEVRFQETPMLSKKCLKNGAIKQN